MVDYYLNVLCLLLQHRQQIHKPGWAIWERVWSTVGMYAGRTHKILTKLIQAGYVCQCNVCNAWTTGTGMIDCNNDKSCARYICIRICLMIGICNSSGASSVCDDTDVDACLNLGAASQLSCLHTPSQQSYLSLSCSLWSPGCLCCMVYTLYIFQQPVKCAPACVREIGLFWKISRRECKAAAASSEWSWCMCQDRLLSAFVCCCGGDGDTHLPLDSPTLAAGTIIIIMII